jgi:hypothetical protein
MVFSSRWLLQRGRVDRQLAQALAGCCKDRVATAGTMVEVPASSTAGSRDFVRAVANMVALRLADASIAPVAREPGAIGKPITAPETVVRASI